MRTVFPPLFTVLSIVICEFCTRSYQQEVVLPGGEEEETHRSKYLANFQYENQSKNKLGCMFSDNLCNSEEICFDDLIFGRCISVTEDPTENELERFPDLSEADKALITSELDQLEEAGLAWDDFFTQCILQNILGSIQFGSEFAESDCNIFLAPAQSDLDLGEDDLGYDLGNEEIPEGFLESADADADGDADVAADIPSGAVPKKTPFSDDLSSVEEAPSSEDEATLTIDEQPDGSLIINSNNEELLGEYLESLSAEGDQDLNPEEGESLVPAKRSVPQIVDSEEMIPENPFANTRDYLDMQNFLELRDAANAAAQEEAMLEDLEKMREAEQEQLFRIQQEEEAEEEEERRRAAEALEAEMEASYQPSQEEVFPPMEQLSDYPEMVPASQMRKLRKRTQDAAADAPSDGDAANFYYQQLTPGQEPLFYAPEEEMVPQIDAGRDYPDYPLPGYPDDSDESYSEPEPNYLRESENNYPDYENDYENDYAGVAVPEGTVNRVRGGGLESNIFNRNGRLDVKKPGPFFPNSANNFFLDKLLNSDDEKEGKTNETDVGQVEYEMPLLAPVKDKRDLVLDQEIVDRTPAEPGFVHIILKKRFDTWHQGANFIKVLAEEFGVPDHALDAREIEDHHVQFHVSSNPQNIDAHQMAKRIDEDGDLRERINAQTGVVIGRAAAGEQHDVTSSLFPSGANLNLLLLTVVTASAAAALLVIGLVALCVRKRTRASKVKKADSEEAEKGKAQEEYQQLCRDWSRTSKKLESGSTKATNPTTTAVKKQMQQRDSKDSECSNRSSTSSWPEEPNTTNMDISTGHMVLAYMEDHLKNKQRLEQEWVALCSYEAEPCATTIAFKAENKKKNRYPDKLPYDHNRVILNAMVNGTNSDYANASTVTDHDPRNPSYIVSQAPLANTVADFWQMIWEQGCVVIVMLTRLQDNGHQLCQRYWPEEGSEQYHIFEVHLVSEHVWCDDYLVRSVYLKNTRTGETRTVTQFHFRSWPAHGVPTSTKALLEFRRKVNKSYRGRSCPIAVHCSDGVGRSGTYILIDMVLNRMSKGCKEIDIAATLEHIRDQRGGMVATRQQFEFCLMAVAEEVHAILKALPQ